MDVHFYILWIELHEQGGYADELTVAFDREVL